MPPYRYDSFNPGPRYEDRYAGAIAGTLRDMGQLRAQTALSVADANARASAASGAIWGQAIGNVGQLIGDIPQQIQQAKRLELQAVEDATRTKILNMQLADREREQADVSAYDQAFTPLATLGPGAQGPMPEGARAPDRDTILQALPGHLQPKAIKHFAEIDESRALKRNTEADYWGGLGAKLDEWGNTPEAAAILLDEAAQDYPEQVAQYRRLIQQNPTPAAIGQLSRAAMAASPTYAKQVQAPKTREITITNPDGSTTIKIVKDEPDQSFDSAPKPEPAPQVGTFGDFVKRLYPGRAQASITGAEMLTAKAKYEAAGRAPKDPEREPHFWVTRNGEILRVPESGIQPGDRPAPAGGGQLTANAEATLTRQLAGQWTQAQKPARDLERQVALIDAGMNAARRGDLAQGAQTVLVAFQKILDPTSVVRESEFDRSAAGQSYYNRIAGAMERITKGGAGVRLEELEKFHTLAKEAAQAQQGAYLQSIKERIGLNADRYNIPRQLVFEAMPEGADTITPAAPVNPFRK